MDAYAVGVSFNVALTGMDALKQASDKFAELSNTIGALETRLAGVKSSIDAAFSNTKIVAFQSALESSLKTVQSISAEASRTRLPTMAGASSGITGAGGAEWENRDFDAKQRSREKQDAQERRNQIAAQRAIDAE